MSLDGHLGPLRENIRKYLVEFISLQKLEDLPRDFKDLEFLETISDFALKGKLIRGCLFLFMAEALGVKIQKKHYQIACSIELLHSAYLMQDDVIDRDRIRRKSKTVHVKFEEKGKRTGAFEPYHYGISSTIVASDVAIFLAFELLSEFDDATSRRLLQHFSHVAYLVAVAEGVDSAYGQTPHEPDEDDIYAVYKYKTARYTFSLPYALAAIVAKTDKKTSKLLSLLGENAGIIYQLRDDEIGLFGDEKVIGKPVGSDIRENKKTIIRYLLYKYASAYERKILDGCFGNPKAGLSELKKVKEIYEKNEIQKQIDLKIDKIMKDVNIEFENLNINRKSKLILKELLGFNLKRSY